jgi:hypothetical protein
MTKKLIIFLLLSLFHFTMIKAQDVNTVYFMENVPVRHFLNPAFQPHNDFYLSLPVIGLTQAGIGNNSLSFKDVIYKQENQTLSFLNSTTGISSFYNALNVNTVLGGDVQTNLLAFGFRHEKVYWTFSITEKLDAMAALPKDMFRLALFGMQNNVENTFKFTNLQADLSLYTEAALGYSRKLDDNKWTVGAKLKYLYGSANLSNTNKQFQFQTGIQNWSIQAQGAVNYSSPVPVSITTDFQSLSYTLPTNVVDWLKPSGMGAGVDIGAEYKFDENLDLSASLTDLGFIVWYNNLKNINYNANYTFDGLVHINNNSTAQTLQDEYARLTTGNTLVDSLTKALKSSANLNASSNVYTTGTTAKINMGAEYKILENKLGFGLLSHSRFIKQTVSEELTLSVNSRPYNWLNASLSTSFFNGRFGSVGLGLGLKAGFIHWFFAADYLAFQKKTFPLSASSISSISVPYNTSYCNFSTGINLVFNNKAHETKDKKIDDAARLGLRNRKQEIPANPSFNIPASKDKSARKSIKRTDGLHRKTKKESCNCDWN